MPISFLKIFDFQSVNQLLVSYCILMRNTRSRGIALKTPDLLPYFLSVLQCSDSTHFSKTMKCQQIDLVSWKSIIGNDPCSTNWEYIFLGKKFKIRVYICVCVYIYIFVYIVCIEDHNLTDYSLNKKLIWSHVKKYFSYNWKK